MRSQMAAFGWVRRVGDDNAEGQNKSLPVATSELGLQINRSQKAQTPDSFVLPMIEKQRWPTAESC